MYTIHGFGEVIPFLKKHTLVVCDLDYTLVHYGKPFMEFLKEAMKKTQSDKLEQYEPVAYDIYHAYRDNHPPIPTDPSGFIHLMKEILQVNGTLMFVTARSPEYEAFTREEFKSLNLDYDFFDVHYIGSSCKGAFCKPYMPKYRQLIFIDDYKKNIHAVQDLIPGSKTFLYRLA
jgi:hypothetical protein